MHTLSDLTYMPILLHHSFCLIHTVLTGAVNVTLYVWWPGKAHQM